MIKPLSVKNHLVVDTDQAAFDLAFTSLARQGKKSTIKGYGCLYRYNMGFDDNFRCGIGHLIKDDRYFRAMEARSINDLVYDGDIAIGNISECLLGDIQDAHDNEWVYETKWGRKRRLKALQKLSDAIADKHDLGRIDLMAATAKTN